jgi:hypothetical protein
MTEYTEYTFPADYDKSNTYFINQPNWYKVDTTKLKTINDVGLLLSSLSMKISTDCEKFNEVKKFLIIPEKPKTLEEIKQELDEKFEKLIERTHLQYRIGHDWLYKKKRYEEFCKRQDADFEYARENGFFPVKYTTIDYTTLSVGSGIGCASYEQSFVIKQGSNHQGYYTFGNRRYFRYYMPDKPTAVVRFFMKNLLGFWWVDDKNG